MVNMQSWRPAVRKALDKALRNLSMRGYLVLIVVAVFVPVLIFSAVLLLRYYFSELARIEEDLQDDARKLALMVDRDLQGQDGGVAGDRSYDRRWTPRRSDASGRLLGGQPGADELADQATDRTPREAGANNELRARERTVLMEFAEDRAEVRPANALAPKANCVAQFRNGQFVILFFKCS